MHIKSLETQRLILREFTKGDVPALLALLQDEEVNTFLPWFPLKSIEEAQVFYQERIVGRPYFYAICPKGEEAPVGYIQADAGEGHDFGYALEKECWHKGFMTEAGRALLDQLQKDGVPYVTATHDVRNPRSGNVMRRLGMRYRYSYEERWQPKDYLVIFRMYQLNLDGKDDRVYRKYWEIYDKHFIETGL